jgi:hypothetical protein
VVQIAVRQADANWGSSGWADNSGAVVVGVLGVADLGPEPAETLAEQVASCFRNKTFNSGSGWFDLPEMESIGADGSGWYQVNVRIPWYHQETVS